MNIRAYVRTYGIDPLFLYNVVVRGDKTSITVTTILMHFFPFESVRFSNHNRRQNQMSAKKKRCFILTLSFLHYLKNTPSQIVAGAPG